jgi:hypothetical protein
MRLLEFSLLDKLDDEQKAIMSEHSLGVNEEIVEVFNALKQIKKECQPFLKAVDYQPFNKYAILRGLKNTNGELHVKKQVRLGDRKPKDTPHDLHEIINDYFTDKFGEPFRNAMFVVGSDRIAGEYGQQYSIFPAGNFTFLWSDQITDLYEELAIDEMSFLRNGQADQVLSSYRNTDLQRAILSKHEIMIRCESYHGLFTDLTGHPTYLKAVTEYLKP